MARIKDIAELAGVSRGTVDRVLNNRSGVSPQTAEKIKEIAKALDYRPNKAGLALAAQKKKIKIGVVLFSKNNPFFDEVSEGVQAKAGNLVWVIGVQQNCVARVLHSKAGMSIPCDFHILLFPLFAGQPCKRMPRLKISCSYLIIFMVK